MIFLDLNLRKKLIKCYIWSMALYGAETWTFRAADQKYVESSEMWCWRRMKKISWTDHVRNEKVLLRVNEQRNILQEIIKFVLLKMSKVLLETVEVFLICCPKCPSFSTIQSHAQNVAFY